MGFEIEITQDKINEEKFNLGHWYTTKRACLLNLPKPSTEDYPVFMDDPCCLVLLYLLRNGINSHFPNVKPDMEANYCFCVHLMEDHGNPICVIFNSDLNLITEIDKNLLENLEFELTGWYLNHVRKDGKFHDQYVINHKHHCCPIPKGYEDMYFDLPDLISADEDENERKERHQKLIAKIQSILDKCQPYPRDDTVISAVDPTYNEEESRFILELF